MSNGFIMGILAEEEAGKGGENIISNFLKKAKVNVKYIWWNNVIKKGVVYGNDKFIYIFYILFFMNERTMDVLE